jgi:hypothetical protein
MPPAILGSTAFHIRLGGKRQAKQASNNHIARFYYYNYYNPTLLMRLSKTYYYCCTIYNYGGFKQVEKGGSW